MFGKIVFKNAVILPMNIYYIKGFIIVGLNQNMDLII
jgi:hypothetical protein